MSVKQWHAGKLIILWAWGVGVGAFALSDFMTRPVESAPLLHLVEILFVGVVLSLLSALTWHWLTGRENERAPKEQDDAGEKTSD